MLPFLICLVTLINGKAVPEDSNIRGYEYTYNHQNGQYELRTLYGKQNVVPPTINPEQYHNPQIGVFENSQPFFLPAIGKSKIETNKMLKDYYGSKNNLNNQFKGMEVSRDYSTSLEFTQNWTPKYFGTHDSYDNRYFENPVISKSKNFQDKPYKNEGSCENCHIESIDEKLETYKIHPNVEYEDGPKFEQSNPNSEVHLSLKKGDKVKHSQNVQSTDYSNKQTNEFEEVNVVDKMKYNGKSTVSEKNGVKYYTPPIRQVSFKKSGSKGKHKKINKYKDYGDFEVIKLVNSVESIKPENKHEAVKPENKHEAVKPENKHEAVKPENKHEAVKPENKHEAVKPENKHEAVKPENKHEAVKPENKHEAVKPENKHEAVKPENKHEAVKPENKHEAVKPENKHEAVKPENKHEAVKPENKHEAVKPENKHEAPKLESTTIYSTTTPESKIKLSEIKNSDSFTKKEKECKDTKSKSNGNVKSCSENEPEIEESPKIVSIKSSGVKSPVVDEYDVISKDNEKNLKEFFLPIEDTTEGIDLMDIGDNHAKFRRDVTDKCNDKFTALINSGDMAENQLDGQCPRSNVATEIIQDLSEVDDKFRRLSLPSSNLWSLIFNPNAKDLSLQKCVTRKNETGHCMYIQNCRVPNIANSLEQLLNNACVMDEVFIGICCPEFPVETVRVQWEQPERNSSEKKTEDEFRHDVEGCGIRSKEASEKNLWPWKAPLVSMSNGKIFCGGVIIAERYILTAAHCTTKIPQNQILVRLGQDDESLWEDIPVIEIKRHAQYNSRTMQNDIALLKLDRRVSHADEESTSIICLPEESDSTDSHIGDKAILLGWRGLSGENPQKAEELEIISNEECRRKLNSNVHHSILCTETRNEDERTCNADSGAPLVIEDDDEYEVIGILSWNRNDCDQRFPSTFSRVSSYLGWIRRHAS